jgi:hypothetical protein
LFEPTRFSASRFTARLNIALERMKSLGVLALSLSAMTLAACHMQTDLSPISSLQYQGRTIPLARPYADIDDFKDDEPRHLSNDAIALIEKTLISARFGPRFPDFNALNDALAQLAFPGYGSFYANQLGAKIDPSLEMLYVEIPQRQKHRYIAVERQSDGSLLVVADFVAPATPELVRVRRVENGLLEFSTNSGAAVLRKNAL